MKTIDNQEKLNLFLIFLDCQNDCVILHDY